MKANPPKDHKTTVKKHTCEFHKKNPGKNYAGCTCTSVYSMEKVIADYKGLRVR